MLILKPITKWYKLKKDNDGNVISKSFNHYEEGHVDGNYPLPFKKEYSNQVAWKNDDWEKVHSTMKITINNCENSIKLN